MERLPDELESIARVRVRKNSATTDVGQRRRLNFIEGSGIAYTIADDPVSEEIDITIAASAPSPGGAAGGVLEGTYPNPGLAASVAGNGLSESADVLSVNVDGTNIEINADTLRLKDTGVTAATYGSATQIPQIAVNAKGQITSASNVATSGGGEPVFKYMAFR